MFFIVSHECEKCKTPLGAFIMSDYTSVWAFRDPSVFIDPRKAMFQDLHVYCERCAPVEATPFRLNCHLCSESIVIYVPDFFLFARTLEEPAMFAHTTLAILCAERSLAWCSGQHLDEERRGVEIPHTVFYDGRFVALERA